MDWIVSVLMGAMGFSVDLRAQANEQRALWVTGALAGLGMLLGAFVFVQLARLVSAIKSLGGLLPICSHCKKVRDDKGYWKQIESYVRDHSDADFSHGLCPDCLATHYPDLSE